MLFRCSGASQPVAVCIVRIELQSSGPLITVTVNRDLAWAAAEPLPAFPNRQLRRLRSPMRFGRSR
jgi:hypothetical protein